MFEDLASMLSNALQLGEDSRRLGLAAVCLRALLIYGAGLFLVRLAHKRFFSRLTPFDMVLGVVLGAVLARTINGSAPLGPSLAAGVVLIALHRMLAFAAFRSHRIGLLLKGRARELVRDGEIDWRAMSRSDVTRGDIEESLRLKLHLADIAEISSARLERNGEISAIRRRPGPRVVELSVAEGVQRIRIEL